MESTQCGPLKICISGLTAAGKTTLATSLQRELGYNIFRASTYLLPVNVPAPKKERLLSWLQQETQPAPTFPDFAPSIAATIDVQTVEIAKKTQIPLIFESLTLPFLYQRPNDLFSVLLLVPEKRRIQRLASLFPELTYQQCATIIQRKDARTRKMIESLWKVNVYDPILYPCYDLILKEDDDAIPVEPDQLLRLILAAIGVYRCYQEATVTASYTTHMTAFHQIRKNMASSISFAHPLLWNEQHSPSMDLWYHRGPLILQTIQGGKGQ